MSDERLAALEEALAHHERQLDELGEVVREQWREIGRLRQEVERLEAAMDAGGEEAGDDPLPPHY